MKPRRSIWCAAPVWSGERSGMRFPPTLACATDGTVELAERVGDGRRWKAMGVGRGWAQQSPRGWRCESTARAGGVALWGPGFASDRSTVPRASARGCAPVTATHGPARGWVRSHRCRVSPARLAERACGAQETIRCWTNRGGADAQQPSAYAWVFHVKRRRRRIPSVDRCPARATCNVFAAA